MENLRNAKTFAGFCGTGSFFDIGVLLALMCATTAFTVSRQPVVLKAMVEEKSHLLEASQENYRNMLERISDGMVSLDKDWRYTYLNDTALANHPGGRESVIGKVIWEVHPEMKASQFWHKYHEAMLTNEVVEIEDYYAPMGIWFSVKVYPSEDGLTIFYKDVSATKRIEQEIVRERNLSETAINSLPGVFYMYDRNGRFLRWNKNFETISGYTAGEIKHLHPLDFFDVDEKELLAQRINKVFETGEADVEAMLLKKNGEKIPYYFNGHLARMDGEVYLLGMGIDITERRKAEKALKESEEKYRYLFNNNPAAIIIWDIETFKVLEVNEVAMEQYGYTRAEFLNLTLLDYRPIEDRPTVEKLAQEQLKANIAKTRRTWRHIKKSGEIMYMDVTSHRIEYGGRGAVLSLAKDITEQVIVENQLKETFEDLKRLNTHLQTIREEERATIAREIHDELGQRLTVLKMDASWLIKKINAEAKAERDKLTGMIALIDDTVKIIRRISSDIRPGVLDDLGLVAALEWQSNVFEKQTGIPCKFTSAFTDDAIDKNLASGIFRVYQETLTNVMRHAQATAVTTTLARDGDDVILCIHDNGQGFKPAVIKSKKTLGLVGMQQRAQMFGGNLTVDSQPGHGTSIILKVPLISTRQKATA
jgi:PAS domain S-box-containing protein